MTLCQTITQDFEHELKNTRKLLERVPLDDAHRNYTPHPKSMSMVRLATHVAELPSWPKVVLASPMLELQPGFKPNLAKSTAELLEIFDRSAAEGRAAFASASDEQLAEEWSFKYGDKVVFTQLRKDMFRSIINHMVHHRAQLGVYLRLNDIPVPGMYGESADEH